LEITLFNVQDSALYVAAGTKKQQMPTNRRIHLGALSNSEK
jgi:hypothetical protein